MTLYNLTLYTGFYDSHLTLHCGTFASLELAKNAIQKIQLTKEKIVANAPYTEEQLWTDDEDEEIEQDDFRDKFSVQLRYMETDKNRYYYDAYKVTVTEINLDELKVYKWDENVVYEEKLK